MNATQPSNPSLTLQLITISIITLQRTRYHSEVINSTVPTNHSTYDYIVVGAGTAGSIVASRLSQNSSVSVLVLEAGGPQTVLTDMPAMERRLLGTDVDWGYRTTPQRGAGLAYGGRVPIPRGRVVGGSHNLNYMVYSRGNRRDFDTWEQTFGAQGWNYDSVLPYFLRSENNTDPNIVAQNPSYHSTSGRMAVSTPSNPDGIIRKWYDMMVANGVPVTDQNGPTQLGMNWFQQTIFLNATRSTTASAYLEAYRPSRPNLQVATRAFVRQILFDNSSTLRAQGVIFEYKNTTNITVYARNEVILCAGSINSPQILMLSGIGPRDHLNDLGIQTMVNLPVGYNLKDHVHVQLDYEVLNSSLITSGNQLSVENLYNYYTNSSGPLSQFVLVYQYMNSRYNQAQQDWPDIQIDLNQAAVGNNLSALVANKEVNVEEWKDYYRPHLGDNNRLVILCFHYRPRSVGRLTLQSRDPHDYPLLNTNYLSDPYDIRALMDAIRNGLMLSLSGDFPRYARLWRQPIPGCTLCTNAPIWDCASYIECYARTITNTVGHQVGTCKMGNGTDSVVDERLRVRGVDSLRVVDASIHPTITNGNTNAPTAMIGEYGSQMIRDDNS